MSNKEILVISRSFPPMGGVGTRRWSKFAKYLAEKGYVVNVITIDYKYNDTVNWSYDIVHPKIIVHRLKSPYPYWLLKFDKRGFVEKKISEICKFILRKTTHWLDNAQGWEKDLIQYSTNLIREKNIRNLIVTGPPFSVFYFAGFIKLENPGVNLILDYRDSWNDERYYQLGIGDVTLKRKKISAEMEYFALARANKVLFTTKDLRERYANLFPHFSTKCFTLHNGFDVNDFCDVEDVKTNKLTLIYTGTLLSGRHIAIDYIVKAISELEDPFFEDNFRIDIYGKVPVNYKNPNSKLINLKGIIHPSEVPVTIQRYSAALTINAEFHTFAFGTKVFDYMGAKKRIMLISNGGELSELLEEKNQYVATYEIASIKNALLKLKQDFLKEKVVLHDYSDFDLFNLTTKLESYFI